MPMLVQYCSGWSIDPLILSPLGGIFPSFAGQCAYCWMLGLPYKPPSNTNIRCGWLDNKYKILRARNTNLFIFLQDVIYLQPRNSQGVVWNFQRASDWVLIKIFSLVELLMHHTFHLYRADRFIQIVFKQKRYLYSKEASWREEIRVFCWQPLKMRSQITCW